MGFLKWFLRWSFKKGHHQNIAYDTFKPKLKTTSKKVIFLTWDELREIYGVSYVSAFHNKKKWITLDYIEVK